ncbi:DNA damage response protein DdrC [Calidithermus chliarophilus]|uniref:DNA damage response protein DdrC n=1 Tax=Calidithermus chliarophilus TaxID=52023 RepID=UPI001C54D552|nr:DNA damage response protein DdrC [Calidithermus chliarophilus]
MNNAMTRTPPSVRLGKTQVRSTPDGQISAYDALAALGLEGSPERLQEIVEQHGLEPRLHNFGKGREPVLGYGDFVTLSFALETPEARRWRGKARDLLRRYLEGDIQLAAEVAERSPSPEHRRWLSARLESVEARKRFMSTVARHGGEGSIYREVSSLSNRSVLQMDSGEFRRKRRVKNTRDGMSAAELLRLSYLETATAQAIEAKGVRGNEQILRLHKQKAEVERRLWEEEPDPAS